MLVLSWRGLNIVANTYRSIVLPSFNQVIRGLPISEPKPNAPQNKMTFDPTLAEVSLGFNVKAGSTPWNSFSISETKTNLYINIINIYFIYNVPLYIYPR
jgi:hypothetical protein